VQNAVNFSETRMDPSDSRVLDPVPGHQSYTASTQVLAVFYFLKSFFNAYRYCKQFAATLEKFAK
jgi:hypothetical protein